MDKCKKHPRYRGIYMSRTDCEFCDAIYVYNHGGNVWIRGVHHKQPWFKRLFGRN